MCPEGSVSPVPCPIGKYNKEETQGTCQDCPKGKQCLSQGTEVPAPCKAYHYCPGDGTVQPVPCPDGTFTGESAPPGFILTTRAIQIILFIYGS